MRIFVLTPIYATTTQGSGATPVVHYFAKEWIKLGHEVRVLNLCARYPKFFYWFGKHFQHKLNSRLGMLVPTEYPKNKNYSADGVEIHQLCLSKFKPHSLYSKRELQYAIEEIKKECQQTYIPDIFIGHWDNPQLEILIALKEIFHKPICLVFHDNIFHLEKKYGKNLKAMLEKLDFVGFRNQASLKDYENKYGKPHHSFIACSGVARSFLKAGETYSPNFECGITNFIFVGSLIARKYPKANLQALLNNYPDKNFSITYIGDGDEKNSIIDEANKNNAQSCINLTGRINRERVIEYLEKAQVFVMISKREIFGLVYLEAMALGLIPIASKGEGIDGIIKDGVNGFLCEAGNVDELSHIIQKLRKMSKEQLQEISLKAKETARLFSDSKVAENYLKNLQTYF